MYYTFCKKCEIEFDLDEVEFDGTCPHCGGQYEWDNDTEKDVLSEFLPTDDDWE